MKCLMPQTLGMSGFVYLSSNSASEGIKGVPVAEEGIKGVPVARPEPSAWGAWVREARCHQRGKNSLYQPGEMTPGALGHRGGIGGAIHVRAKSVGSQAPNQARTL